MLDSMGVNWKRGMFRAWVVLSVAWLVLAGILFDPGAFNSLPEPPKTERIEESFKLARSYHSGTMPERKQPYYEEALSRGLLVEIRPMHGKKPDKDYFMRMKLGVASATNEQLLDELSWKKTFLDIEEVKNNIRKLVDKGAGEDTINQYLGTEGYTFDSWKQAVTTQSKGQPAPSIDENAPRKAVPSDELEIVLKDQTVITNVPADVEAKEIDRRISNFFLDRRSKELRSRILGTSPWLFIPPAILFVVGYGMYWVVSGFRKDT